MMDPYINIARQRQLAAQIVSDTEALTGYRDEIKDGGSVEKMAIVGAQCMGRELAIEQAAKELAELVTALDEWQAQGGFSPYPLRDETIRVQLGDKIDFWRRQREDSPPGSEHSIAASHEVMGLRTAYSIVFGEPYDG